VAFIHAKKRGPKDVLGMFDAPWPHAQLPPTTAAVEQRQQLDLDSWSNVSHAVDTSSNSATCSIVGVPAQLRTVLYTTPPLNSYTSSHALGNNRMCDLIVKAPLLQLLTEGDSLARQELGDQPPDAGLVTAVGNAQPARRTLIFKPRGRARTRMPEDTGHIALIKRGFDHMLCP